VKIVYICNDCWFFHSHRLPIAEAMLQRKHDVYLIAKSDPTVPDLVSRGLKVLPWNVNPRGSNPVNELKSIYQLSRLLLKIKPDLVHCVTIKPVIYGGLLARIIGLPAIIYAISGLGAMLQVNAKPSMRQRSLFLLYRLALGHKNHMVIFQNSSDRITLPQIVGLPELRSVVIRGSGIDLKQFSYTPEQLNDEHGQVKKMRVILIARLLKDKGISEFVEAASIVKLKTDAEFLVVGGKVAQGNPAAYSDDEFDKLVASGSVDFVGQVSAAEIARYIETSNLVILPSYHEGLPKVLVEAAACGRAVVTTDVPGCRYAVEEGVTALIVPCRDAESLAAAIDRLLSDDDLRIEMGKAGRRLAEREFGIEHITSCHLDAYRELLTESGQRV